MMARKRKRRRTTDASAAPDEGVLVIDAELPEGDETLETADFEALLEPAEAPGGPEMYDIVDELEAGSVPLVDEDEETAAAAAQAEAEMETPRLLIAIASGKGGVGKSLLAANIGIYLAQLGRKVVLVDGTLGAGNLHTMLQVDSPDVSLGDFFSRDVDHLRDVVVSTPFAGLGLISGVDDGVTAANPRPAQKNRLLTQLRQLNTEYVIVDLAPGCGFNVVDMFIAADLHVVVTHPEPTAIESAFRLIKCAFMRKLRALDSAKPLLAEIPKVPRGIPSPRELLELAGGREALRDVIREAMGDFKPRLVVNGTRTREDLELGPALTVVGRRHLGLPLDYLGYLEHDDAVGVSVRRRRPLQVEFPEAKVSKDIDRVARRLLGLESHENPACAQLPKTLEQQSHYELLGLHPGATEPEIRRAHRHVRRLYHAQSNAIFGIVSPAHLEAVHERIELAYATLIDPEKRDTYSRSLFPDGQWPEPSQIPPADAVPHAAPTTATLRPHVRRVTGPMPRAATSPTNNEHGDTLGELVDAEARRASGLELVVQTPDMPHWGEDTEFTGDLLRKIREACGVDLRDVADQTKISLNYLRAIETEDWSSAPAPVYLRGFVKAMARCLRLPPDQVARTYMARFPS
ncbi:MAG: helix-turn-helix domain-containing protein [Myxococcales bacterium]|nr:helix-turn-helix domain-containing protein [Myxococcales bacterium]